MFMEASSAWLDTHVCPGLLNCRPFVTGSAKQALGSVHSQPGKAFEIGIVSQASVTQGLIPDAPGLLPGEPTQRHCRAVKRMVGNPRIQVHPAVVIAGNDKVAHMPRLRVLAQ